jgi:hypothetical protein
MEPTIPAFELVKTFHVLGHTATVIGHNLIYTLPNVAQQGALETKNYRYIVSRRDTNVEKALRRQHLNQSNQL